MHLEQPLVSITLSAYNVERYIADSLDCLVNQTYKNIEIICIDDGSKDNTLKILQEYAAKDNRITIISKPKNEGLAVARNQSLKLAKGKYIIFLDGDDLFDHTMIEKAVLKAEKDNADMIIWDYVVFYNENEILQKKDEISNLSTINPNEKKSLLRLPAFTWTKLFKTQRLKEINIQFPKGLTRQDIPVHWKVITSFKQISIHPEKLSYYRQQPQATTAGTDTRLFDLATVMDITKDYLIKHKLYDKYKDTFLESQLNLLAGMHHRIDRKYKPKALKIINDRLKAEQINYVMSNKPLRKPARWFYKGLLGDNFAKIRLSLRYLIKNMYRKIKAFT